MPTDTTLGSRKLKCEQNLKKLKSRINGISIIKTNKDICLYVTGSYARLEANKYSDLDLFLLKDKTFQTNPTKKIEKILLDAELIKITRIMKFGEFSNDGQYLEIHHIDDILNELGCAEDDYKNYFTARMLLLLESRPLYNKKLYDIMIRKIIYAYFRDYHDHDKDFKPIFLVNDIIRYYKTMCLNYEHKRNRPTDDRLKKNKAHLKNLKLKFSRLLTCYSMIIALINQKKVITPDDLLKIVYKTPIEKLIKLKNVDKKLIQEILHLYVWFLELTGKPEALMLDWIGKKSNRDRAFDNGREFHKKIYKLLKSTASESDLMYLAI